MKRNFTLLGLAILCLFHLSSNAQIVRNYGLIYTNNMKGGHTMFGNTSMARETNAMNYFSIKSNGETSDYGNDNANMQFVDVDGTLNATALINYNDAWYYHNGGSKPSGWPNVTTLSNGPAASPFYYGFTSTGTQLSSRTTHYFVKQIAIANTSTFTNLTLDITYESAFVVYVNGSEVARHNIGPNPAANDVANSQSSGTKSYTLASSAFTNGTNTIQVEMHRKANASGSNDDINFNLKLTGNPVNTFNSSQADLILPAGTNTIKFARLYWGGKISSGAYTDAQLKSVKIRKGSSGNYGTISATSVDKAVNGSVTSYQSYADITNFVKTNGAGTYTVADILATPGSSLSFGSYAGWSIVVAYENPSEPYRSVRIYDGFLEVDQQTTQAITLTGLDVPNNTLSLGDAYMSTMAWEGDANLAGECNTYWDWSQWKNVTVCNEGDFIKVNNNIVSNAINPTTNMWNGTISKNGQHVTTKLPNYKNQMGIDIDEIQVGAGYGINPGAKSVSIEFGTEADQYFPSLFAFSIVMKSPTITIDKNVQDLNGAKLAKNDELLYTLSGKNTGEATAYKVEILDILPSTVEFIPGSVEAQAGNSWIAYPNVVYNPAQHSLVFYVGSGATSAQGGNLDINATYKLRYKVKVLNNTTIINKAIVTAKNEALTETYTDEASVLIAADEIPLPVKFKSFSGVLKNNSAALIWETASEDNASHFELERSVDARTFNYVASVNAHGTSTEAHRYSYNDNVASLSASTIYYRLKIVDIDGKVTFSKIIALNMAESKAQSITIYPNPLRSGQDLKLQLSAAKEQETIIKIISNSGQVVLAVRKQVQPGSNIVVLNELSRLNPGLYVLQLTVDGQQFAQNILRQ